MSEQHEWATGDIAYVHTSTKYSTKGDVFTVGGVSEHHLTTGTDLTIHLLKRDCAPVFRGKDLPPMPYGGRLARIYPHNYEHGSEKVIEPESHIAAGHYFAVLEVYPTPTPEPDKDAEFWKDCAKFYSLAERYREVCSERDAALAELAKLREALSE